MDQTRLGIIGYGYWGPNLVRNFVELPVSEVVAVADCREERLAHMRTVYPQLEGTTDYRRLFSMGLDAAVIATPPDTHCRIARDCLEHDLHVLVEKPLALTCRDAEELVDLADRKNAVLMVGHTFEYNPAVRALKDLIESGRLGEIYYVDAVRANLGLFQPNLNVLWDLAPHDLSILRYILGQDPIGVSARGSDCIVRGIHDIVYLYLTFPKDILAHVHISWLDPCKIRRITVVGSQMMAVYDDVDTLEKIRIYDKGVETPRYTDTFGDFQCSYRYGDVVVPNIHLEEPLRIECQHFIDCIKHQTEPQSSGRVGRQIVKILELADRSLHNSGRLELVPSDTGEDTRASAA